ncbi:Stp1/IreP family PP2C-type Ser/Thr phosphatase [Collinsella sp. AGMB00827]|uniref:Stp1/IreP family PP2C-type Ser/Thr phosphatase n=2 Tax=Collinsella ureilytica TaxID=2869515 RepID=A0ABS7MJR2_9ACTN|nr:Stp1/IreP family PP2C-type Ser/Thr phosphatase [Collinsella urealyticum]
MPNEVVVSAAVPSAHTPHEVAPNPAASSAETSNIDTPSAVATSVTVPSPAAPSADAPTTDTPTAPASSVPAPQEPAATGHTLPNFLSHELDTDALAAKPTSPEDTAEIDVQTIEALLDDPGSTQSFAPITDELIDTSSTYDAGTTTSLMWGARSDVGCVRSHNEDSYLVQSPLFCVCDGMGGHAAGEVASSIAVETIAKTAPTTADPALLGAAVEAANAAVIEAAQHGLGKPGMGCTATAAFLEDDTVAIAHVGDSRAYLLHDGTLIRITRDHSFVEELVDAGEITADEARVHPNRSVITRALGSDPSMYADHFKIGIEVGDRLILCSDGLSSMVSDGEIERIAAKSSTAQICTDNLVDAALTAGGTDNVTVVVVDLVDDGALRREAERRRKSIKTALLCIGIALAIGAVLTFTSIVNSIYLGTHNGTVAIFTGIPGTFLGFDAHWLHDTSTVSLNDLPDDTKRRLYEGIPQDSVDAAMETISKYRKQISEEQAEKERAAASVRSSAGAGAHAEAGTSSENAHTPSDPNDPNTPASGYNQSSEPLSQTDGGGA